LRRNSRYREGTGKEAGKKIKKERSNGRIIEESEGKEAKKYNANK
jgi:hypothetical protein